jgi:hypothetical protein
MILEQINGQIELTQYLESKIKTGKVMDLTSYINSQGKAQYSQIQEVVFKSYEDYKEDDDFLQRMTNAISIYVLSVSKGYMDYLRKEVIG